MKQDANSVELIPGKLDFLVIGAQKSGTSALDHYLRQHPEIGVAKQKELHFFDNEEIFKQNQPDYSLLENQFDWQPGVKYYGEATPIYLYWEPAIRRIWEYNPTIKIIGILRNPVDRAFSHWNMEVGRYAEREDFFYCIRQEQERCRAALPLQHRVYSYLGRGFYSEQIRRVFRFFPPAQVLFLKYESFLKNQEAILLQVFDFLGADAEKFRFLPQEIFAGNYPRPILPEEKAFLLETFENDVVEVEKLLGWNCQDWKN